MFFEIKKFFRDDGAIKVSRSLKELNIQVNKEEVSYEKLNSYKTLLNVRTANEKLKAIAFCTNIAHCLLMSKEFSLKFSLSNLKYFLELDDDYIVSMDNIFFLIAMNTKYEGGGYMFCPDADPTDGKIDFLTANNISRLKMLRFIPKTKKGTHTGHKGITIIPTTKISLRFSKAVNLHTDGEVYGKCDSVTITCSKDYINFLL